MRLPRIDSNIYIFIDQLRLSNAESNRLKRCVAGYSSGSNLSEKLAILVFRIKNLVLVYFGKSDLKLAEKALNRKFRTFHKINGKKILIHNLSDPNTVKKIYSGNKILKKLIKYNRSLAANKVDKLSKKFFVPIDLENKIDQETSQIIEDASEKIIRLANYVFSDIEKRPFPKLSKYWTKANLDKKRVFVEVFSTDHLKFKLVRDVFASIVYRPVDTSYSYGKPKIVWQPRRAKAAAAGEDDFDVTEGVYCHATDEEWKEASILKSKEVWVDHKKIFKGAFVSTRPEFGFGKYILVFNRSIERLSFLENGFENQNRGGLDHPYWAGFSKNIPVTPKTLAFVIVSDELKSTKRWYDFILPVKLRTMSQEEKCSEWAGRSVKVITISEYNDFKAIAGNPATFIPREWPANVQYI